MSESVCESVVLLRSALPDALRLFQCNCVFLKVIIWCRSLHVVGTWLIASKKFSFCFHRLC